MFAAYRCCSETGPGDADCVDVAKILNGEVEEYDAALLLDETANVMVRSGQHCLHSWFNARKILGSCRASFYFYNTKKEIDIMIDALKKIVDMIK